MRKFSFRSLVQWISSIDFESLYSYTFGTIFYIVGVILSLVVIVAAVRLLVFAITAHF